MQDEPAPRAASAHTRGSQTAIGCLALSTAFFGGTCSLFSALGVVMASGAVLDSEPNAIDQTLALVMFGGIIGIPVLVLGSIALLASWRFARVGLGLALAWWIIGLVLAPLIADARVGSDFGDGELGPFTLLWVSSVALPAALLYLSLPPRGPGRRTQ